jgi:hypothetical protein
LHNGELIRRKDEELTTADLAGRSEKRREAEDRAQLVPNPQREQAEYAPVSTLPERDDAMDPPLGSGRSTMASGPATVVTSDLAQPQATAGAINQPTPLFSESEVGDFRSRWGNIQTAFVDEPRRAVEDADNLVASLMKKLAEGFANERARLEKQWDRGDNVSTEDLRIALQRYRSFFDRLLKV